MAENQLKITQQIVDKLKDFVEQNKIIVITTTAFMAIFGFIKSATRKNELSNQNEKSTNRLQSRSQSKC